MLVSKGRLALDRDVLLWVRQSLALPKVALIPHLPRGCRRLDDGWPRFPGRPRCSAPRRDGPPPSSPARHERPATALGQGSSHHLVNGDERSGEPGSRTFWRYASISSRFPVLKGGVNLNVGRGGGKDLERLISTATSVLRARQGSSSAPTPPRRRPGVGGCFSHRRRRRRAVNFVERRRNRAGGRPGLLGRLKLRTRRSAEGGTRMPAQARSIKRELSALALAEDRRTSRGPAGSWVTTAIHLTSLAGPFRSGVILRRSSRVMGRGARTPIASGDSLPPGDLVGTPQERRNFAVDPTYPLEGAVHATAGDGSSGG
jgi:hypothetical protein